MKMLKNAKKCKIIMRVFTCELLKYLRNRFKICKRVFTN